MLKAWGVLGDAAYQPLLVEGWGAMDPTGWVKLLSRLEYTTFNQESETALLMGLAHSIESEGHLGLYWKTWRSSEGWTEIAGSVAAMSTHQIVLQLDGRFQSSFNLTN